MYKCRRRGYSLNTDQNLWLTYKQLSISFRGGLTNRHFNFSVVVVTILIGYKIINKLEFEQSN